MRSGLVRIVVQHEAGNDFGFADRRVGLLEDSFVEREKAQAGITPPVVVIGPVDGAGQSDHLGDSLVVRVSTVSSLRPHPSMKRWDAYTWIFNPPFFDHFVAVSTLLFTVSIP